MSRHRFLLILWASMTLFLAGLWWHSLQGYSYVPLVRTNAGKTGPGVQLSWAAGEVGIYLRTRQTWRSAFKNAAQVTTLES